MVVKPSSLPISPLPCVAAVFLGQWKNQRLVVQLGVGVCPGKLQKITSVQLASAIKAVLKERMVSKAKSVGETMRQENGARTLVQFVETHLRDKVATGEWRKDFEETFLKHVIRPDCRDAQIQPVIG